MVFDSLARRCLLGCWSGAGGLSFEPFECAGRGDAQNTLVVELHDSRPASASPQHRFRPRQLRLQSVAGRQSLFEVPLRDVKHVVLAYLAHCERTPAAAGGGEDALLVLDVPCGQASVPLQFAVNDSLHRPPTPRQVLALFTRKAVKDLVPCEGEHRETLTDWEVWSMRLRMCARCGAERACNCGWRVDHGVSRLDEQRSLLGFIDARLPRLPAGMMSAAGTFRLHLGRGLASDSFEARILSHAVVHPAIEPPCAVFTIEIRHEDLTWRITRRYRHFTDLHARLKAVVPVDVLPQLPPRRWMPLLERNYLLRRQLALANYLRGLLMIEQVEASVPMLSFLGALSTTFEDQKAVDCVPREVVHLRVLKFHAAPGDVLLFHCHGPVTRAQRSVTGSEWDHVALVVPSDGAADLQLLEATGEGVIVSPMTSRILSYCAFHIDYVALRRLRTPLITSAVRDELLRRFVTEVEGMPYGLTLRKVLSSAQQSRKPPDDYFCSELAAEAFKALGIVGGGVNSGGFWPGSFASGEIVDSELARHGAALSREQLVDCRLLEVAMASTAA